MFNRVAYKDIAKKQLRRRWTTPIVASIITCAMTAILYKTVPLLYICALGVLNLASAYLFVVLSHTTESQPFSTFVQGFSYWLKGLLGMLWFLLWVVLWACLFVIPGFVKAFAYSQMFYIIAENPDIEVQDAMNLSKKITQGHKMDLFVMELSFLGWIILSCMTGGILFVLYVYPYMNMAFVNAFHSIKQEAIDNGTVKAEDFMPSGTAGDYSSASADGAGSTSSTTQHVWDTSSAEDAETVQEEKPVILLGGTESQTGMEHTEQTNNEEGTF